MGAPEQLVREVIAENRYLSLATAGRDGQGVATVAYTIDEDLNLYFVSLATSRHVRHIEQAPGWSCASSTFRQPFMTGRGIQIEGVAAPHSETENPFRSIGGIEELPCGAEMPPTVTLRPAIKKNSPPGSVRFIG